MSFKWSVDLEEEGYILQNGAEVINKPGHKGNIFK